MDPLKYLIFDVDKDQPKVNFNLQQINKRPQNDDTGVETTDYLKGKTKIFS